MNTSSTPTLRNIGIFAHVDAGKTTLSERLLAHAGAIREVGAVDRGTAHTDRLDIERRRGISIRATCAQLAWRGVRIQLMDTPGHADFAAEVSRALFTVDGAVLLLSAAEGVQPRTEALFAALSAQRMPVVIFLNKTDREGADPAAVIAEARQALSTCIVDADDDEAIQALMAEDDAQALEDYLEGNIYPHERLTAWLHAAAREGRAYPAYRGSALRDEGIPALLDAVVDCLPAPGGSAAGPLSGIVFAVEDDRTLGRAAHVRLFSGMMKNRDGVLLPGGSLGSEPVEAKISQIRTIPLEGRGQDLGQLSAGEIGAVYGLGDIRVGQVLGDAAALPRRADPTALGTPLLMVSVTPDDPAQKNDTKAALSALAVEDPLLAAEELAGTLHIRVMGAVQLEVVAETLRTRFGIAATFGAPRVIYRETITQAATGFYAYTMPKPCWAVIEFYIEPLPRGSGVQFVSQVPARDIMPRYQHQVEQAIPLAIRQGMLGWQVDDVRITLTGGEHHLIHTHPLDFIVATPIAFLDGLRRGGSTLLEPILRLSMTVPEETSGRVMAEVIKMRGEVVSSAALPQMLRLTARVPLKDAVDFPTRLAAMTGGRGALSIALAGYEAVDTALGDTCPRRGVHPLDTAKYILAARSALDGGIFDL